MPHENSSESRSAFDAEALDKKYAEERAKRLRSDGTRQYRSLEIGSALEADPFVTAVEPRESIDRDVTVAIVGAGFSGLLSAVRLRQEGVEDFLIIDKAADFGGTWYWNRYPGIACDVESYCYLPMIEDLNYMPTQRYIRGDEIREYMQTMAKTFGLYPNTVFQTQVQQVRWDASALRWVITTNRSDEIRARYVILGTGGLLHRPKLPELPGLDSFAGKWFHASRWDFSYTGGGVGGGLDGIRDKKVAIIGTGPTALQCIPHLAASAEQLYVIQRTPTIIDWRGNRPTDPEWFANQEPGWHRRRSENFEALLFGMPQEDNLTEDAWTTVWGFPPLDLPEDGSEPDMTAFMERVKGNDHAQMERIRARVDEIVADSATAEALKPWYATHCKRPGFSDEYLQVFNRPNVTLVDTDGKGAERIDERGVVVDGTLYEVDCIIYATGFDAAVSPGRSGGFQILGTDGIDLTTHWSDRVRTLHGIGMHGFPNMFIVGGVRQTAITISQTFIFDEQAKHVAGVLHQLLDEGVVAIEITEAAEDTWIREMDDRSVFNEAQVNACTPGYFNNEGDFQQGRPIWADAYGGGPFEYVDLLTKWREARIYTDDAVLVRQEPSLATAPAPTSATDGGR